MAIPVLSGLDGPVLKIGNLTIDASGLTAARSVAAPDKSGTLAMTSDIGGSGLGYLQTWQIVTGSRSLGTTYYNTTGAPIVVRVTNTATSAIDMSVRFTIDGVTLPYSLVYGQDNGYAINSEIIVPPDSSYAVATSGGGTITWAELR